LEDCIWKQKEARKREIVEDVERLRVRLKEVIDKQKNIQ
jgi:hypothetical protein